MTKLLQYGYKGLSIKKQTIRDIFDIYWIKISELKKADAIRLSDLTYAIESFHVENGGTQSNAKGPLIKILNEYSRKFPKNVRRHNAKGYWFLNFSSEKNKVTSIKTAKIKPKKQYDFELVPKKIYGKGSNKVYVFYDSQSKGCKIGKTINSIEVRYSQFKTAIVNPWSLEVLILFENSQDMSMYEQVLKNILKIKNFQPKLVPKGNGTEHFSISPNKLLSYISQVNSILGNF